MRKKKLTVWQIIGRIGGVLGVIGLAYAGYMGIMKQGEKTADTESRLFTTEKLRYDTEKRTEQDIDAVTLSWKADTLSKRTDTTIQLQKTLIIYQMKLDTMYGEQNKLLKETLAYNKYHDSVTKIENAELIISRAKRIEQNIKILDLLKEIKNDSSNE